MMASMKIVVTIQYRFVNVYNNLTGQAMYT
jgi:hypothetical protein